MRLKRREGAVGGSDASGMHGEGPTQGWGGQGTRGAHGEHGVHGDGPIQGYGGQGTRGAHNEHLAHGRDLGRVEAERLVERRRELPSRKAGMRRGKRYGPGGVRALGCGDAISMHREGPTQGSGARARVERTQNMVFMFVTLDVSQLEMSALKF